MKGIFIIAGLSLLFVFGSSSCSSHAEQETQREANNLYEETYKLVKLYTDSMRNAPDSAAVAALSANYERRIAKLNFQYKPDTDLDMTEQENDTLFKLISVYVKERDSRLEKLHLATFAVESETKSDSILTGKEEGLGK